MIKLITYIAILVSTFSIFSIPFISALLYSFVSLLQPQFLWKWDLDGIPIFNITAGLAIIAWAIASFRGNISWAVYKSGIVYSLLLLLSIFYISDFFTPFPDIYTKVSASLIINTLTTIVIMFLVIIGTVNNEKALKYSIFVLIGVVLYYTYWANSAYFNSEWFKFAFGRLNGPTNSPYKDGNVASVMFVIAIPFLVLAIYEFKNLLMKAVIVSSLIFILHAIILFASRGALISIGISMIIIAFMVKSRLFNTLLLLGFIVFIVDQGGQLMSRTKTTIETAQHERVEPINPRLVSWEVGLELTKKHPLLGVGPQRFLEASRTYFPGKSPHVAHNTLLNFAANTGLIAGFLYLSFFWVAHKNYQKNSLILSKKPNQLLNFVNRASYVSMAGFFTAAFFLDLIVYEPFYFLLVIIVITHNLTIKHGADNATNAK